MRETVFQYHCRLTRSFFRLGIGYINPWSHFFLHPIVFELWDSFCQDTEEYPDNNGSNEMDTLMQFADDAAFVNGGSPSEADVDLEQEALLLEAHSRAKKRCAKSVSQFFTEVLV